MQVRHPTLLAFLRAFSLIYLLTVSCFLAHLLALTCLEVLSCVRLSTYTYLEMRVGIEDGLLRVDAIGQQGMHATPVPEGLSVGAGSGLGSGLE